VGVLAMTRAPEQRCVGGGEGPRVLGPRVVPAGAAAAGTAAAGTAAAGWRSPTTSNPQAVVHLPVTPLRPAACPTMQPTAPTHAAAPAPVRQARLVPTAPATNEQSTSNAPLPCPALAALQPCAASALICMLPHHISTQRLPVAVSARCCTRWLAPPACASISRPVAGCQQAGQQVGWPRAVPMRQSVAVKELCSWWGTAAQPKHATAAHHPADRAAPAGSKLPGRG
jgi:hypothetical protein